MSERISDFHMLLAIQRAHPQMSVFGPGKSDDQWSVFSTEWKNHRIGWGDTEHDALVMAYSKSMPVVVTNPNPSPITPEETLGMCTNSKNVEPHRKSIFCQNWTPITPEEAAYLGKLPPPTIGSEGAFEEWLQGYWQTKAYFKEDGEVEQMRKAWNAALAKAPQAAPLDEPKDDRMIALDKENQRLQFELTRMNSYEHDGHWRWDAKGENHLESLTCAIVIWPNELRDLLAKAVPTAATEGTTEASKREMVDLMKAAGISWGQAASVFSYFKQFFPIPAPEAKGER